MKMLKIQIEKIAKRYNSNKQRSNAHLLCLYLSCTK